MKTPFDQFWNLYDRKISKEKVEKKFNLLSAKAHVKIMETLPAYIKATPDKQFRKHPLTYLNSKTWNDELETAERVVYKQPNGFQSNSNDFKPKPFERSEFIKKARERIEKYYESGIQIKDWGNVHTNLMIDRFDMIVSKELEQQTRAEVQKLVKPPKNRFEPHVEIDVDGETRDRMLSHFLTECKNKGRNIVDEL